MGLRAHVTLPFDRLSSELKLPTRGTIPAGAFVTRRPQPAPGWDAPDLPVPELQVRRARQLYERGIITPAPQSQEAEIKKGKRR